MNEPHLQPTIYEFTHLALSEEDFLNKEKTTNGTLSS